DINLFKALFAEMDIKIIAAGLERNISDASDKLTFVVGITRKTNVQMIVEKIEANDGVVCVSVELML
ncbi:MAG: hypothetical protein JW833_04200, partial [Prolixibacteraceae bacterium]|nr:hypothetical protein [Prolixibacteraceae bacterium]